MKKIVSVLFVMLLAQMAWAQKPKLVETSVLLLSGSDSSRLEYVTVQLLRSPDKHLAYGGISNGSGYVHFGKILPGNYLLVASSVGYQVVKKTIEVQAKERYHYNRLYLPADVKQLQTVEVHGQQDGSKMALNKLVYIPDSLGLAHAITAFDLLNYAPGVHVKKSSKTISIMGNKKVLVMVGTTKAG